MMLFCYIVDMKPEFTQTKQIEVRVDPETQNGDVDVHKDVGGVALGAVEFFHIPTNPYGIENESNESPEERAHTVATTEAEASSDLDLDKEAGE